MKGWRALIVLVLLLAPAQIGATGQGWGFFNNFPPECRAGERLICQPAYYSYQGKTYSSCLLRCEKDFAIVPESYIYRTKEVYLNFGGSNSYPKVITASEGSILRIEVKSFDGGVHLKIPAFDIEKHLFSHETGRIEFIADKSGEFDITGTIYDLYGYPRYTTTKLIIRPLEENEESINANPLGGYLG